MEEKVEKSGLPLKQASDQNNVDMILKLLEEYFVGKVIVTYERCQFLARNKRELEP